MKNCCETCIFWRYKSDDSTGRTFGICDNPDWKVSMYNEDFIQALGVEKQTARLLSCGIRTEGTFKCNQFVKET